MKLFYLDTETTGLHAIKNDIIQMGGIIEINRQVQTTFNFRCKPINWDAITKESIAVHGISKNKMRYYPQPSVSHIAVLNILKQFEDGEKFILAGQGIHFDKRFLKAFFEKQGNYFFEDYFRTDRVIDLKKIVKKTISLPNYKLITIADACGLKYKAHDAFGDITATRLLVNHFKEIRRLRKKGMPYSLRLKKQGVEKC